MLSLNFLLGPNSRLRTHNQGGLWSFLKAKNQPSITQFRKLTLIHSFLIMPQCPMALLRGNLLSKLRVFITIPHLDTVSIFCTQMAPRPSLSLTPDLPLDLPALDPQVGDTDHPSIDKHHPPVHSTLKDPSTIITQQ